MINTEIVKRNDFLAEVLGEEMVEGSITKGDQIDAKKNFEIWLTTLEDQKRKKTIADGIAVFEKTAEHVDEYVTARTNLHESLTNITKLGEGKFLYNMYVAITGVDKAPRNSPEDARWGLFVKAYLKRWGFTRSVVYARFLAYKDTLALVTTTAPTLTTEAVVKLADQIATLPKVTPSPGKPAGKLTDAIKKTIAAASKKSEKSGLDLNDAKAIQELADAFGKLKPSSSQAAHDKKEVLMGLHNDTMKGILRVCKATESGFEHGNVERVVNDFIGGLLKGLGYTETSVSFEVKAELDDDWYTWKGIIPKTKTTAGTPPPPVAYSAHGFYIVVSTEDKHKSERYRVYQRVEGKEDKFQKPFRKEEQAKEYIAKCEELEAKADQTKPATGNNDDQATGTSAGA
jgi:hypothetical protein